MLILRTLANCIIPNPVISVSFSYAGASDFSQLTNEVLSLPLTTAVNTAVCRDIAVTADMIVEENEIFTISVQTSNPNDVIMGPTTATIAIVDDDSKYKQCWSHRCIKIHNQVENTGYFNASITTHLSLSDRDIN